MLQHKTQGIVSKQQKTSLQSAVENIELAQCQWADW